jgi:outer membrane protein
MTKQIANMVAVLMVMVLTLAGCAVLSPTDAYAPVPTSKASEVSIPKPSQPFPEKETAPEEKLTLERSIKIALANNPEVAATLWDVSVAGSREDQAKAARWGTLTYEGSYTKYLNSRPMFDIRYNGERRIFSKQQSRGDVILKLPLFTGGRIINDIKAAELFRLAEEKRLSRTRDELIFNVSSTFYGMLSQKEVIDSLKFSLEAMEEQRKKTAAMLEVAKVARVDLLRTEVRLADLQQSLEKEKNVLDIQKRLLANLLGLDYAKAQLKIDGKLTFEKKRFSSGQLVPLALERRPDFMAAKERLESQARRVDVARAGHAPNVNLVGAYGYRGSGVVGVIDERATPVPGKIASSQNRGPWYDEDGLVGVTLTLPLFEGGRITAKVREELAALAAAQERLRKLNLQVRTDVETAILDVDSSSERVKATEKAVEQARESLRIETLKYSLGSGSITDVLDAQSALLQTETTYYRALSDFRTAIARLKLAVGGELS